jgi:hypothetical protein
MQPEQAQNTDDQQDAVADNRPTHSEDGVDLTLIRWMLSLTPMERLQVLQQHLQGIMKIREANPHL